MAPEADWSKQYKEHNGIDQGPGLEPHDDHEETTSKSGDGCRCAECVTERGFTPAVVSKKKGR